jgi:hypothetical protein
MSILGLVILGVIFALLAIDAFQFDRTSRHRVWAVPPSSERSIGTDPLSLSEQQALQTNKFTAVGGIPGLYWVFVGISVVCLASAGWLYFT